MFKILIYKYYKLAILLGNENFYPEINAWFLATLMTWFNLLSLIILLKIYLISVSTFKILLYLSGLVWVLSIYYFLRINYKDLLKEAEKRNNQKLKTIFTIIYSVTSLIIYGYLS
jgi:hypothetical protein